MRKFEEVVRAVALEVARASDVEPALRALGPRAALPVEELSSVERGRMADDFVRNLGSLSVYQATDLDRLLLMQLDAAPSGRFTAKLDGASALTELRNHLKHALTALGLDWEKLTRAQSLVAGVARWLQAIGGATMEVNSTTHSVDFLLTAQDRQLTPELVRQSPLVQMLRSYSTGFAVSKDGLTVAIIFSIQRH
jgi:hypothetical protein